MFGPSHLWATLRKPCGKLIMSAGPTSLVDLSAFWPYSPQPATARVPTSSAPIVQAVRTRAFGSRLILMILYLLAQGAQMVSCVDSRTRYVLGIRHGASDCSGRR